jgi:hypothetical protein
MDPRLQGLVIGFILCLALLFFIGSMLDWREKRHKERSWCERRPRGTYEAGWRPRTVYRDLPGPDMTEKQAKRYAQHARFSDASWPGQRNGALVGYLTGRHDAATMESKLDERFGFSDGPYGYRRGKLLAEHEQRCQEGRNR